MTARPIPSTQAGNDQAAGRLIAVVGPSGVGKDCVMEALAEAEPALVRVRRAITRAPGLGGEDYAAMTEDAYTAAIASGAFCLHWRAHGLGYGVPAEVLQDVRDGADRLVNLSRGVLVEADALFPSLVVLSLTARAETLARRIVGRGRESLAEIEARLARAVPSFAAHLDIRTVSNDGHLSATVASARRQLQAPPRPAAQDDPGTKGPPA
ncbi:MAG: phosphonate metabolism protein/1,5-bisphosphokinase (PRPP-forming) PhnN [Pseudomonadota bacterium]